MNEQKDAVQEAVEALKELESRYAELYGFHFSDYDKSIGKENIETISIALKSRPVDVEELKEELKYGLGHISNSLKDCVANATIDYLTENGYRITKER